MNGSTTFVAITTLDWVGLGILAMLAVIMLVIFGSYFGLWLQAKMSRAGITLVDLIGMSLRKVNRRIIVSNMVRAKKAGLAVNAQELETHYLAGGNVTNVITGLIATGRVGVAMDWKSAADIDLAGYDVMEAVHAAAENLSNEGESTP